MKRTIETTKEHLDKQIERGDQYLYLHMTEWTLFEMALPAPMRLGYAKRGYNTAINPINGEEESCLEYKMKPIFSVACPNFTYD